MTQTVTAPLDTLLEASTATPEFREAVLRLSRNETPGTALTYNAGAPPVKVLRTITKLLEMHPELPIANAHVDGHSGCSHFSGSVSVNKGDLTVRFKWDCAWRAEQEGFVDALGYPDQIRAAQTFGYQCFEEWAVV